MTDVEWHDEKQFLEDIKTWKTGDVVFKRGAYTRSLPSMAVTNSYWSHVLFVYRPDGEILKQQGKWIKDSDVHKVMFFYFVKSALILKTDKFFVF